MGDVNTSEVGLGLSSLGPDIYSSVPTCGAMSGEVSWHQPIRGQGEEQVTNQRTPGGDHFSLIIKLRLMFNKLADIQRHSLDASQLSC